VGFTTKEIPVWDEAQIRSSDELVVECVCQPLSRQRFVAAAAAAAAATNTS
jgi:hypothetical protein